MWWQYIPTKLVVGGGKLMVAALSIITLFTTPKLSLFIFIIDDEILLIIGWTDYY